MTKLITILLLAVATNLFAQQSVEVALWPNGAPNSNGLEGKEQELENGRIENVNKPVITVFPSPLPSSVTIIMCPGGGYTRLAMLHEGFDMASWFNAQGITYVVLKYRMPNGNHEVPLSDAEQAIRLVRQHATQWNVDPQKIGIMGASAGGHLASTLATHYSSNATRPDFQILLYPVITMNANTHPGSRSNLLGLHPSDDLIKQYSNELHVDSQTPKAFIALSSDDSAVVPQNGVEYYLALVRHKVPVTLHTYPTGGHGWGFRDNFIYKRQWTGELEKWLQQEIK